MSLKEFSVRCSAITLVTANAFGIAQTIGPRLPRALLGQRTGMRAGLSSRKSRFGTTSIRAPQGA